MRGPRRFEARSTPPKSLQPGAQQLKRQPGLEDIAGSKHWDNKCDLGLCVHRPKVFEKGERKTDASLIVLKSRYDELGYPCKLAIEYSVSAGRFKSVDYQMGWE